MCREISSLYDHLISSVGSVFCFDDILRIQVVNSVSAIDRFIHDLIRTGIMDMFIGNKAPTDKYLNEPITLKVHHELVDSMAMFNYTNVMVFEKYIIEKFKIFSFEDPDKISDGLSYIWNEKHKWQKIANFIALDERYVRTKLKLIVSRRNGIVHESDRDYTGTKIPIDKVDCDEIVLFIENCGKAIFNLAL